MQLKHLSVIKHMNAWGEYKDFAPKEQENPKKEQEKAQKRLENAIKPIMIRRITR